MESSQTKERRNQSNKTSKKVIPKRKKQCGFVKLIKFLLVIAIVLVVIGLGMFIGIAGDKIKKLNYVEIDKSNLGINEQVKENLKNYRNIVLFGVDTRDIADNTGSRSDAIIIISIDKSTKEVKLTSVYRDTYMYIDGYGLDKITHAYAYGGPELAIKTLNQNLDLNIEEYITVNFASVANIINSIGGIEINIEEYEIAQMNKYIKDTSKNTGINSTQIKTEGLQTLDGVQAVTYSRIRKTVGGDYKRTERMRTVLNETLKKVKESNVFELNRMLDTVCENVQTNLTSKQIMLLIPQTFFFEVTTSIGWPYEVQGITLDRWYGVPVNLKENVKELHEELFGTENYVPTETVKEINNRIINKTGIQ